MYHVIIVVDLKQVVDDFAVVWHLSVMQRLNVLQNVVYLLAALGGSDPELALGVAQALRLDVLDLHDSKVSLLSPL